MEPKTLISKLAKIAKSKNSNLVAIAGAYLAEKGVRPRGDFDFQVTPAVYAAIKKSNLLKEVPAIYGDTSQKRLVSPGEVVELFDGTRGFPSSRYAIQNTTNDLVDVGQPYKVWGPELTLKWKKDLNRPKDQPDIKCLKKHLESKATNK